METIKDFILPIIGTIASALVGWWFGRTKEQMEVQTSELDNVDKAVKIYREMIEDLSNKYAKAISDLEAANLRIRELEESVDNLVAELKKYKQLNGKAKE